VTYPTLAAPEPVVPAVPGPQLLDRHGQRPLLWVIHDTESPNVSGRGPPGWQDIRSDLRVVQQPGLAGVVALHDRRRREHAADGAADGEGVDAGRVQQRAISDEFIGYASQTAWPSRSCAPARRSRPPT
jgi:hypothetical protein